MTTPMALTARDHALLEVLTRRLRCLSVAQVATHWWPDQTDAGRNARSRLRKLEAAGFLTFGAVLARPLPKLLAPVLTWKPHEGTPDFAPIAYHLKQRFSAPVVSMPVVVATQVAASRLGGKPGRLPRRSEATHDLGLASVFLSLLESSPAKARYWISEADLVKRNRSGPRKVPDALIRSRRGTELVIEFGGEYSKGKLLEFHTDCAERGRRYELW